MNDASIVQKYSCKVSKLSDIPGVIFSKRVTVDDVPRKTFFFAPRGDDRPLTFRVVVMEYRSMPTHVAAGRTLRIDPRSRTLRNVSIPASPASDFRCFFELFCLTISSLSGLCFKVKEQLFNLIFCRLISSVRDVSVALESFEFSLTVRDRVVVRRRGKPAYRGRFCLVSSQGRASLTCLFKSAMRERSFLLFSFVSVDSSFIFIFIFITPFIWRDASVRALVGKDV